MTTKLAIRDDGSGLPVVWIHGYPLSAEVFDPQVAIDGVRHLRPDLPGFGGSAPPQGPTTVASYAQAVLGTLDALGVGHAVFAGVSMGGYVVMQILRDAPDRVSALLLLDTRETPDSEAARKERATSAEDVRRNGTAGVVGSMLPKMVRSAAAVPAVRRIMESASPEGVIAALGAMAARPDSTDTLRSVRVPALIVCGEDDAIAPPADARRMQTLIPHAQLVILAGAAHLANFDQPEEFNRITEAFLADRVVRPR